MPAPYPVHREATAAPVLFHPLPRATADRYRREAEAFDREAPRAKGHQSLLASALKVYKAILSFIDHAPGRCDLSLSTQSDVFSAVFDHGI